MERDFIQSVGNNCVYLIRGNNNLFLMDLPEEIQIKEWDIQSTPTSFTAVVVGPPKSGKSTFLEDFCYYNKHRYPVARVFSGTEDTAHSKFARFIHPFYINSSWDEEDEKKYILRQKTCIAEEMRFPQGVNIVDDCTDNAKVFQTKLMKGIFKLGTQHFANAFFYSTQYAFDLKPELRKCISYAILFREPEAKERKKLYENFGGITGSFKMFNDLMDALTGDYTAMVIDKGNQKSNKIEDCVFWFRTVKDLPRWRFGCDEYCDWADQRYNSDYVEELVI
jgi:hypothetical protein